MFGAGAFSTQQPAHGAVRFDDWGIFANVKPAKSKETTRVVSSRQVSRKDFAAVVASPAFESLSRLRNFRRWQTNWDGEGAPTPDRGILNSAITLLSLLLSHHISFAVHLTSDSKPVFYLRDSPMQGEIEFVDENTINFEISSVEGAEPDEAYAILFDKRAIPAELCMALQLT